MASASGSEFYRIAFRKKIYHSIDGLVGAAEAALCALIEPFYPKREWGAASAAEEPKVCGLSPLEGNGFELPVRKRGESDCRLGCLGWVSALSLPIDNRAPP